jgi:hypothetical protein
VAEKYPEKPSGQLTSIFIKALGYDDRREEYRAMRDGRITRQRRGNHRISNDIPADDDISKYFTEA